MSLFKDMLHSDETLFKNEIALSYDFIPKLVPYREQQQRHMALCIKPLFNDMNGRNLIIHGPPGVGKTVACKHVIKELEEETDDIIPLYVNCWQKNTTYKVICEIAELLDYKFIHNKKTDEIFDIVKKMMNKKAFVLIFDEVDKLEDYDFLYMLLESIYKKSIFLITNYKEWATNLDSRVKSRLVPEMCEFRPYSKQETHGILDQRISYAFHDNVWEDDAFTLIADRTAKLGDIRTGLYLLKEAGITAEEKASRRITKEHVEAALTKLDNFSIKPSDNLEDDTKFILDIISENSGEKIGDLFKIYQNRGGERSYKSFQRKMKKLEQDKFVILEKSQGIGGNTTIVKKNTVKRLTEF
jgi:cell division control protein 6